MQQSNLKLAILIISLSIFQVIINNSTILYVDCLSVVLVALLFNKGLPLRVIIGISVLADLMGHCYLGSHLFGAILLSFLSQRMVIFFSLSGRFQQCFIISIFYAMLSGILALIGLLTHNSFINWLNFAIEIFVLCPIIFGLLQLTNVKGYSSDIIF